MLRSPQGYKSSYFRADDEAEFVQHAVPSVFVYLFL